MVTNLRKNNDKLAELLQKRDELLEKHPHLQPIQEEIELDLQKAGKNPLNRCVVIQQKMKDSINKMSKSFNELHESIRDLVKITKE